MPVPCFQDNLDTGGGFLGGPGPSVGGGNRSGISSDGSQCAVKGANRQPSALEIIPVILRLVPWDVSSALIAAVTEKAAFSCPRDTK